MKKITLLTYMASAALVLTSLASCDKVSPFGILVANTSTDERVEMSYKYFQEQNENYWAYALEEGQDEYTFLVGADSHLEADTGRLAEMFQMCLDNNDLMCAHLGDIADTKADCYILLEKLIKNYRQKYIDKQFNYNYETGTYTKKTQYGDQNIASVPLYEQEIEFPLHVAVGNHDITRNGWALFSNIFRSSFFQVYVVTDWKNKECDRFIFLDSASGTLGNYQIDLLENDFDGVVAQGYKTRHVFVFTHTNIFRPQLDQFSSTYPREELYYLLNKFKEWESKIVFLGHVHTWDERQFNGIQYLILDSMGERNSPDPGDYLVRVHVKKDGDVSYERVRMNYVKKDKK